jgi:hypothetical protein
MVTKIYYDCEFLEDGYTVDLISIGMHAEDGREYYAVSTEFDTHRVATNKWLMENVMSSIGHEMVAVCSEQSTAPVREGLVITDPAAKPRATIAAEIIDFVAPYGNDFEWWAWYGAYDHVALCQLFGPMIDLPKGFPMMTMDIKQVQRSKFAEKMPKQPEGKHNALADARWNRVRLEYLEGL